MSTLAVFVGLYVLASIAIGLYAARKVKNSKDYVVAGRNLPLYIGTATVFATWFGSETVLGTSSTFVSEGMAGIVADPFGAALCLILVGLFFAKPLYKKNFLTIGDFYREKYGRTVEVVASICIMLSYLGWVSAQIIALGVVFNALSGGAVPQEAGMVAGAAVVLVYTLFGGMWSVAMTDFFQMIIIMVGMLIVGYYVSGIVPDGGGMMAVVNHAAEAGKLDMLPALTVGDAINYAGMLAFVSALLTLGFGSIPQQDVFQRVMSSKDENTAQRSAVLGGVLYFFFAFVPIFLGYSASLVDPAMVQAALSEGGDTQLVLPNLILAHTPVFVQVMFFGALLSAIMSTASGTLLAPSTMFVENILKPFFKKMGDKQFLTIIRSTVVIFGILVTLFALNSDMGIFGMVENAYKVTLAGAFAPLAFGVYWKRANAVGAILSMSLGIVSWISLEITNPEGIWPPQLVGLLFSVVGMVVGSYLPRLLKLQMKEKSEL